MSYDITCSPGDLAGADPAIVTYIMPLPAGVMNITIDLSTLLGGVLFPFSFSFIMPVSNCVWVCVGVLVWCGCVSGVWVCVCVHERE